MRITEKKYLATFTDLCGEQIQDLFEKNAFRQQEIQLDFRIKTSAVYSANIEGNSIDINSFLNSEVADESFKPRKEVEEISDLVKAYQFAITHSLTQQHMLEAHRLLSSTILILDKQGKCRTSRMGVYDNSGLVYMAVEPQFVKRELDLLFLDIDQLLSLDLSLVEAFYHASLIHLKLAQIHPFWDGNGRTARLLEKWFLASHLGVDAWKIESEQYYKQNIAEYYKNINLGIDYYALDFDRCVPFLLMLVNALKN